MSTLITIIVTFFAGMGAGLGTGFAGLSAAAVISPMLITFLGMDPYMAVGIALSSDVLASAVSAYTYGKNKNLDVKNGLIMMVTVLCFTVVGSYVSSLVPSATMGNFSVFMTFLLGIKFIVRPVMTTKEVFHVIFREFHPCQFTANRGTRYVLRKGAKERGFCVVAFSLPRKAGRQSPARLDAVLAPAALSPEKSLEFPLRL